MAAVTIRLYEPGDEARIVALFNSVFPVPIDLAHWHWKYRENPAALPTIGLAVQASEIVGHVCFHPVRILVDNRVVIAVQAVDVMLDKRFHGLGGGRLLARIWKFVEDTVRGTTDTAFLFGFTIPRLRALMGKVMQGREVTPTPFLTRTTNPAYLAWRLCRRWPALQRRALRLGQALRRGRGTARAAAVSPPLVRVTAFGPAFDRLWDELAPSFRIAVVRDRRYLGWRYAHPQYVSYALGDADRVRGCVVLRTGLWEGWRVGYIADLWADDPEGTRRLVAAAVRHFRAEGTDLLRCWMTEGSRAYAVLRRHGFVPRASDGTLMVRSYTEAAPQAFLEARAHWYVTLGDSDSV
jgi:hypothetical protein